MVESVGLIEAFQTTWRSSKWLPVGLVISVTCYIAGAVLMLQPIGGYRAVMGSYACALLLGMYVTYWLLGQLIAYDTTWTNSLRNIREVFVGIQGFALVMLVIGLLLPDMVSRQQLDKLVAFVVVIGPWFAAFTGAFHQKR